MTQRFSEEQISKWANDYERVLCAEYELIADRYSIAIIAGQGEYEIPNFVSNIRGVLWLGKEIYPKGFRTSIITGDSPTATTASIPMEYVVSGKGLRRIRFLPTPSVSVAEYTDDLFTALADAASVTVEVYRTPSLTDEEERLPQWMRRYLLKDYICSKAFKVEGPTQDLRASGYYENRLTQNIEYVKKIKQNMHMATLNSLRETVVNRRSKVQHPVLPDNFAR